MKSLTLLLLFCLTVVFVVEGQEAQLVLTKKSNAKEHTIIAGKKVTVYISESSFVKGELVLIDSASISIGKDTVPLSKIFSIKAKSTQTRNKGRELTGIGSVLILVGGVLSLGGAAEQKDSSIDPTSGYKEAAGIGLMAIGGVMTGAGVINLAAGKNYKRSAWKYSVRN